MSAIRLAAAAAAFAASIGMASAQGTPPIHAEQPADPVQSAEVDGKYTAACTAKVAKELCACVVAVANIHVNDVAERQVFYDYMMGDIDKAQAERAMFPPEKTRTFNVALQKADTLLGEQCDKVKDMAKPDAQTKPQ